MSMVIINYAHRLDHLIPRSCEISAIIIPFYRLKNNCRGAGVVFIFHSYIFKQDNLCNMYACTHAQNMNKNCKSKLIKNE